jgi:hemin uptake protein HemP
MDSPSSDRFTVLNGFHVAQTKRIRCRRFAIRGAALACQLTESKMRRILILMNRDEPTVRGELNLDRQPTSESCAIPRIRSAILLAGKRELIIEHAGREYRLRVTAQGKLILTA